MIYFFAILTFIWLVENRVNRKQCVREREGWDGVSYSTEGKLQNPNAVCLKQDQT